MSDGPYESEHAPFTLGQATLDEETGELSVSWSLTQKMDAFRLDRVEMDETGTFFTMIFRPRGDEDVAT